MRRSVTGERRVKPFSGTFQLVRKSLTGASRESFRSSTRRSIPVAATGLEIEAAWKSVPAVTESAVPASFTPKPCAQTMRPLSATAIETPGTW